VRPNSRNAEFELSLRRTFATAFAAHPGDVAKALDDASKAHDDENLGYGEGRDAYTRVAFAGTDPLDPATQDDALSFARLAIEVFGPLLEHREGRP